MAVKRPYAIPSAREAIAVFVDGSGDNIDVHASRELYRWLSQIERLVGKNSVLSAVEDENVEIAGDVADNAGDIVDNQSDINTNNTSITQINADLVIITTDISTLATDLGLLATAFGNHASATSAHGSNGYIVGNLDLATLLAAGLVKKTADPGIPAFAVLNDAQVWCANLRTNLIAAGII